jgi:hypothetical protein
MRASLGSRRPDGVPQIDEHDRGVQKAGLLVHYISGPVLASGGMRSISSITIGQTRRSATTFCAARRDQCH